MCQQALEKLVKGLYLLYIDDNVPRLHDINAILSRFEDKLEVKPTEEYLTLFDTLSKYYLRSRYPDYTPALASFVTDDFARSIYIKSKEAFQCLLKMKPSKKS